MQHYVDFGTAVSAAAFRSPQTPPEEIFYFQIQVTLNPPKNDLDLDLDMRSCPRLFSNLRNYKAESRFL